MTIKRIRADVETRSPVDLRKCGAFPYFEHPGTKVLMCAYRLDDNPMQIWTYDKPCPEDLKQAIIDGAEIHAFNAQFETLAFDLLAARNGWPKPRYDRYVDTMAAACAMALPRSLDKLGDALGLNVLKDKEGYRLIRKFSIPRKPRKNEPPGLYWNEPEDHVEDFKLFKTYCMRDVEVEEAAAKRLFPLSNYEQKVWLLNQEINRRGIRIDTVSANAAIKLAEKAKARLDREMKIATAGYVGKCSEPGKLIAWAADEFVPMGSAAKGDIADLLSCEDLPDNVRTALELRLEGAKTSVSKLNSMIARSSSDGRVRGSAIYHGASTGRDSDGGVNFKNLPRPRKIFTDAVEAGMDMSALYDAIRKEDPDLLTFLYGDELGRPMHLLSDAIRGFIWSAPGHELVQADYSGIEGVVIAWLSGEDWKLEAMRQIKEDPSLPDMYRRTAASIMGLTTDIVTKKHPYRQSVGKVSELALGFGGGVSAFWSMASVYGVDLGPIFPALWQAADDERCAKAAKRYENSLKLGKDRTTEMSREAWLACELIKVGWRASNPAITQSWRHLESAIRNAIAEPGQKFTAAKCTYIMASGFLLCKLPSGRVLSYASPKLRDQVWAKSKLEDGSWSEAEVMDREKAERLETQNKVLIQGDTSPSISALGVNSMTKKWQRFHLYGGLAAENNTQATARDLMVNGMFKAEEAGYKVLATVYDELITEVPHGFGDMKAFEKLICELPAWAEGLPLSASGWRGKRYRKD